MISTPPCKTMLSLTTLLCRRVILSFYHIFSIDIVYRCRSLVKALSDIVSGSISAMTYEQFFLFHWVFLINELISAWVHPEYEFGLHTTISRCKWSVCICVWMCDTLHSKRGILLVRLVWLTRTYAPKNKLTPDSTEKNGSKLSGAVRGRPCQDLLFWWLVSKERYFEMCIN